MEFLPPLINEGREMWLTTVRALPNLGMAVLTLLFFWLISMLVKRIVKKLAESSGIRPSLIGLFETMAGALVWTIGVLVSLTIVFPSLTPAKLLAALGLGSVAVGFAFKDIFENFLAGILIMLRKPMRIDDFIECGDVSGRVEKITIRDTYVRKIGDELILVPNSLLFKNPVFISTDQPLRRYEIVAGVAYDVDLDAAQKVIQEAVESLDVIEKDRPVQVFAREFNSSSIDFTVRWWAGSQPLDMHQTRDEVIRAVKKALDSAGMEIPFPYRTMTFKQPLQVQMNGAAK
ncbi:MAG: mechanosensitive ion channel protein MscS [Oceanospirillaceae bacterium]|nr:mechanosensitive ion channel protein MscS [Oceanospirillaceae bacterium]